MNRNDLYRSLGEIDDAILERSETAAVNKRRRTWIRWGVLAACLITAALIAMLPFDKDQAEAEKVVQEKAQEFMNAYDSSVADQLEYKGLVSYNEEIHVRKAEFECGDYRLYYDLDTQSLSMIYNMAESDGSNNYVSKEEIEAEAFRLLQLAQGPVIAQKCISNVEEGPTDSTVEYTYFNNGTSYPAGIVSFSSDGQMAAASFNDILSSLQKGDTAAELPEEAAYEAAAAEARRSMRDRSRDYADRYQLDETSVKCDKVFRRDLRGGRTTWKVTLLYTFEGNAAGGVDMDPDEYFKHPDFYFEIFVDAENGKILENANNWS